MIRGGRQPPISPKAATGRHPGGGDVLRVKVVISKQELRRLLGSTPEDEEAAPGMEQLLRVVWRRIVKRMENSGQGKRWRPALRSIPEEI
ncbi:hypothetical protein AXF42_Ash009827 [Apostasia shenzhenica]|uniref:Uncharacterized protein n=1 Tax=Apostasia shenzhenica TaxID=1088818 RepID=A0A2I0AX70_9ASPA|nr:hypothetical protein AXF42_Ash009827 [Apostasia shenzhenica]